MSNNQNQPSFFFTPMSQASSIPNDIPTVSNTSYNDNQRGQISSSPASPSHLADVGRRYSNGLSRMAFSIYGNQFTSGSPNKSSYSSGNSSSYNPVLPMRQSQSVQQLSPGSIASGEHQFLRRPTMTPSSTSAALSPPVLSAAPTTYDFDNERIIYNTQNEVLAIAKAHETPNLIAMATAKNLQLLKVSSNDIILEQELSLRLSGSRSSKFGIISDLSFGHQQYGRYLAAGTINGSIHVYNLDRGIRVKTTLVDHQRAVNTLDFNSTNGYMMLSGSQDGKIKIWDLRMNNTRATLTLNGNADAVRGTQFNPKKANILASVFDNGVIEKWDIRKPNSWERRINAHNGPALAIDWHPELEYVVTGGRDKQLQVWNMESGSETREPSHVIYTSGPISKAKWCKGSGNRSIMNTDIATCFLNDDPCIQIWNLSRKYIPKNTIEWHSGQITQLLWRTPKHLISSCKDKSLVQQDVTKASLTIDNFAPTAIAWDPKGPCNISYVKQERSQFERTQVNLNRMNSTADSISSDIQSLTQLPIAQPAPLLHGGKSSTSIGSPRLNSFVSASSFVSSVQPQRRPLLPTNQSRSALNINSALIVENHVDVEESNNASFEYLSSNYLINIPEDSNILDVCEFNANEAMKVGYSREYHSWITVKTAIEFDLQHKQDQEFNAMADPVQNIAEEEDNESNFGKMESTSRLGTSYNSMMTVDNMSGEVVMEEEQDGELTDDRNLRDNNITLNEETEKTVTNDDNIEDQDVIDVKSDFESDLSANKITSMPINIRKNHRYSFTSSVDFDDEKSRSPISFSPSPMLPRNRSALFSEAHAAFLPIISKSVDTKASKSQLTEIIRNSSYTNSVATTTNKKEEIHESRLPWDPSTIIKSILDYEANEGNILLCATFSFLFKKMYPDCMTNEQAEEWILLYHDYLTRNGLFINAAIVVKAASKKYSSLQKLGQTQTSIRTFCSTCHNPILNEQSKEKLVAGNVNVKFGFWYCDRCKSRQGNCVFCEEPIKKNAIGVPDCHHIGHFTCLRTWFITENQNECPGC